MIKPVWPYRLKKSHPLYGHVIAAWVFDNAGGQVIFRDLVGVNNGFIVGSTIKPTVTDDGIGIDFTGDNSTDRINLGSISSSNRLSLYGETAVTIFFKGMSRGTTKNLYPRVIDKSNGGGSAAGYSLFMVNTAVAGGALNTFGFQVNGSLGFTSLSSVPLNRQVTLAASTLLGTSSPTQYYIDGLLDYTTVSRTITPPATTTNAAIGNWNHSIDREWDGTKDCLYVFDKVLSANEIKSLNDDSYQIIEEVRPLKQNSIYAAISLPAAGDTYTLTAATGAFNLTGNDTSLLSNKLLQADSVSFNLTGNDTGLLSNKVLSADSGAFNLTGNDALLVYTPITGDTYTLTAEAGAFNLTGNNAGLLSNKVLSAETGIFNLTGNDALLVYTAITGDTYTLAAAQSRYHV